MSMHTTPKVDEGQAADSAATARAEEQGDVAITLENQAAKEWIADADDADAGKALQTTTTTNIVEPLVLGPLPPAPALSIPSILRLHPGFSSRKIGQAISHTNSGELSGWRVSCSRAPDSLSRKGSLPGSVKGTSGILRMPMSAIGIGFGENERLKHARFQISPQVIRDIRPRRYLPPARRDPGVDDEGDVKERRNSLNDSTHRRMLANSFGAKQTRTPKSGTTVPVEFPETTFIGPGRLPTFEEQKLIRLARGTAIATVKTVIAPGVEGKREKHSVGSSRSLLSIEREDRRDETTKDVLEQKDSAMPVPPITRSLTGGKPVARTDIILCKFYHTPGLRCTASPCRFIHEINRSAPTSTIADSTNATLSSEASSKLGTRREKGEDLVEEPVEIVEVFRMSGGGKGAGSIYAKAKFKTNGGGSFSEPPAETDDKDYSKGLATKDQSDTITSEIAVLKDEGNDEVTAKIDRAMPITTRSFAPTLERQEFVSRANKDDIGATESIEGDIQRAFSCLQSPLSTAETSTKDNANESETIAPLSPRQSTGTIVATRPNPSIMLEDRPLTWSREGTPLPNGSKAIKFKSSNIVVPDYRWTKDEGMVASPSAVTLEFPQALQDMNKLASSSSTLPIWSSGKVSGNSLNWADPISPRTIVTPVQYANAPPVNTWRKVQPLQKDYLSAVGNTAHQSATGTDSAQDESPLLPITAHPFSTDSSPPETPATQQQEVVTPENHHVDLPAIHILHGSVAQAGGERENAEAWRSQEFLAKMNTLAAGHHDDMYATTSIYPWMVETFLLQLDPAPMNEMWLDDPLSSGYGPAMSKNQFARQLARQAKSGDLPPQVPQNKTNYRTQPCKHYAEGRCLAGDKCHFAHVKSVIPHEKDAKAGNLRKKEGPVQSADDVDDSHDVQGNQTSPGKASNQKSPTKKKTNKASRAEDIEIVMNVYSSPRK
ncbi:hypothetical protein QFC21_005418 [Naganishia friedmannii]|uniref:Uncharacterized protein n=1 Tax=Naganishia friedmannii TaxID=89922 RepID=A0ACC2V9K2_9TREE|nr:hypothetical protein QFC21_005418 [Naganishia friedmannii]